MTTSHGAPRMPYQRSLKHRLLLATLLTAGLTLLAAGFILAGLFREHVRQQFVERLSADLDQVMARLQVNASGQPVLDPATLSDPRWSRPRSGLYWQVDAAGPSAKPGALLRSRSLWDEQLDAPRDLPANGALHVHELTPPRAEPLLLIERSLRAEGASTPWRVMVAADLRPLAQATQAFNTVLAWSLLALLLLLALGAWLQVSLGLAPLARLRQALAALREGRTQRLEGQHPAEVQPLVDDLNGVLDRHAALLQRARAEAGNLAHALKTPLTVLSQGAAQAEAEVTQAQPDALAQLPSLVAEQVAVARRQVDWHLARSRAAAAAHGLHTGVSLRSPLRPAAEGLLRVLDKVHADRKLSLQLDAPARLAFAGEPQDLQEMLGNLLDNACKAARTQVQLHATQTGSQLHIAVDDDGPGIPPAQLAAAVRRGTRLDETTPGSGLGLAIVQELATLYGGALRLGSSPLGGLRAELVLPAA